MIDVSIIVPVYNVEKYLSKCLDSLVSQDYNKNRYEIIAVNDCSQDNSFEILKEYKDKYSNLNVIDLKENHGVSYARNKGIELSKGEYLMFCDADDYYDVNSVSVFMNEARANNSDFVIANHYINKNGKDILVDSSNYFNKSITAEECIAFMTLSSCSKLIKKSVFTENSIIYPINIKNSEEMPVIPIAAYYANNPIFIDKPLYHYVQRSTSASNNLRKVNYNILDDFSLSFGLFKKMVDKKYKEEVEYRAIEHLLYGKSLIMLKMKLDDETIINNINDFKKEYPNYLNNKYFNRLNKFKRVFIKMLDKNTLLFARMFAKLHQVITG